MNSLDVGAMYKGSQADLDKAFKSWHNQEFPHQVIYGRHIVRKNTEKWQFTCKEGDMRHACAFKVIFTSSGHDSGFELTVVSTSLVREAEDYG
jgi:hypothetical protein